MNNFNFKALFFLAVICLEFVCCTPGKKENEQKHDVSDTNPFRDVEYTDYLYQYSFIDALLAGVFDGTLTIGELKSKGDLGIGGFNGMDGELYMDKGAVYKIRYDGSVHKMPDETKTPVAFVKNFKADTVVVISGKEMNYEQFKARLQGFLNKNGMYALRVTGRFPDMTTRAPAPAKKPYPSLVEHLRKNQYEFALKNTRGTAVGFYLPAYMGKINVPGAHLHYLSEDQITGGHILDFTADSLQIEIDKASGLIVKNPDSEDFRNADLQKDRVEEVEEIE